MALTRITKGVIKPNENYDTHNINSTGIVTAIGLDVNGNGDISGNLSVGGVLTYEDVTSIDSVGIITARDGIDCNGDIDVDGHTNLDNVSVAGVSTFSGDVELTSTDSGAAAAPTLRLQRDSSSPANQDVLGQIVFGGKDSTPNDENYASVAGKIIQAGAGGEHGAIQITTRKASSSVITANLTSTDYELLNGTNLSVDGNITGNGNFQLTSTDTGSTAAPEINLFRNSVSPADADYLGQIKFSGKHDAGSTVNYAKITGKILDASNGTEDGIIEFAHIKGGSQTITGRWRSDSLQLLNDTNLSVAGDTTLTGDLDVDGQTSLDHTTIAGIVTFLSGSGLDLATHNISAGMRIINNGNPSSDGMYIGYGNANNGATRLFGGGLTSNPTVINSTGVSIPNDLDVDGHTNLDNVNIAGVTTSTGLVNININASQSVSNPLLLQNSAAAGTGSNPDVVKLAFGSQGSVKASIRADVYGNGNLTFHTNNDTEKVRITAGGNVQVNGGALHLDASGELAVFETDTNLTFTNSAKLAFDFSGNVARIRSSHNGSGTTRNLGFYYANSQKLLITTDKVMFSADAKVDSNNQRDLGTSSNRWKSLFLGTQLEIDAASSTEMIRLDVAGTNFATIGHNTSSGSNMLDVRSEGHTRFLTGGNSEKLRIASGGDITANSSNITQSVTSGAAILKVQTTATSGDALIQASGEDSSGNTRMIQMRTDAGASQYRIISSDTSYPLALCTGNSPRILIAGNSAATSIGGSNVFNAMLTVQGDVSGQLFHLKSTENTSRMMVSGNNSSGCEVNLYDDAGAQKGILAVSSTNFAIKATQDVNLQFMTNDGYGTVERAKIDKHGILRAHGFRRNAGNHSHGFTTLRNGYQGDDFFVGPSALYYVGHKNSSPSSNYSAHELTIYRSGHWGQYPQLIVYAFMHYYQNGYKMWHVNDEGGITEKHDFNRGGDPSISSGGQQLVGSGTHGGQNVHKYHITFTNGGIYQQVKWFVGWIGGGGSGHIGSNRTVSQADDYFRTRGGGLHFVNVAHETLQASFKYNIGT